MSNQSNRLTQNELNQVFLSALGQDVSWHSGLDSKPLEVDISKPYLKLLRVYIYNATYPPGGRTLGERKIQLIVPGQARGERGNFDHSDGRLVLLVGYESAVDVFVLWDAGTYRNFAYSMNVQVNPETIFSAFAGKIELQTRRRRTPEIVDETVICAPKELLLRGVSERIQISFDRALNGTA